MACQQLTKRMTRKLIQRIGVIAALVATVSADAAETKPYVQVQFEVAVPEFQRNLPQLAQAQATVGAALAKVFADKYVFANW